ncbi:MAG: 2-phospho-L-lactate transferase [Archaeoglobaceae archaeon]
MLCVLSGGTGTCKLLQGLKKVERFTVIINTGEDVWVSGNKLCPDVDSVLYSLADIIDTEKWWGVKDDTFVTHSRLKDLGFDEGLAIGDMDRAVHIARSDLLRKGHTLTQAVRSIQDQLGIEAELLPMCEDDVLTYIITPQGEMHFQEFWVKHKGEPDVLDVAIKGANRAEATPEAINSIRDSDAVMIGPSNPITSVMPILSVNGIKKELEEKKVIAISPIIGKKAFSGPAAKLMAAKGYEVSPTGVADCYQDFLDILVVDEADKELEGYYGDIKVVSAPTIMKNRDDAVQLAEYISTLSTAHRRTD